MDLKHSQAFCSEETHTWFLFTLCVALASFSARSLCPNHKAVSLQLENGLCSAHTHRAAENKTGLSACRLSTRLPVQARRSIIDEARSSGRYERTG